MGASIRPREFDSDPSQTEQLANWITKVRSKKIICRRNRKRNLRVEAVLTSVLYKAETELRIKQMTRIQKWQQMRQQMMGDVRCVPKYQNGVGCGFEQSNQDGVMQCNDDDTDFYCYDKNEEHTDLWNTPELSSFQSFMSQLNEIKVPLQR